MIRDFMMKPVQGALFWKYRNYIMGVMSVKESTRLTPVKESASNVE